MTYVVLFRNDLNVIIFFGADVLIHLGKQAGIVWTTCKILQYSRGSNEMDIDFYSTTIHAYLY